MNKQIVGTRPGTKSRMSMYDELLAGPTEDEMLEKAKEVYKAAIYRHSCYKQLLKLLSQFDNMSDRSVVLVTSEGEFAAAEDSVTAHHKFLEKYPGKEDVKRFGFLLGRVRHISRM